MKRSQLLFIIFIVLLNPVFSQEREKPVVSRPVYFDVSPPFRDIRFDHPGTKDPSLKGEVIKNFGNSRSNKNRGSRILKDKVLQNYFGRTVSDSILRDFEGVANSDNEFSKAPPDPCGDISPDHYVQIVNISYAVYSRNGNRILGPLPSGLIWQGLPYSTGSGDGIVLYDEQSDRWFISQFSFPNDYEGPFFQLIAVSQTPDPTGNWYRWEYMFNEIPDYPKFGIWPDGYYMSCDRFSANTLNFHGAGAIVFDRDAMLAGDPNARMVMFTLSSEKSPSTFLPSDCDGSFPSSGTPGYFTFVTPDYLGIYDFHVNWSEPMNSTFDNLRKLEVAPFYESGLGISQSGSSQKLDPLSDRLMYRLQYRKFNDHESMVVNHSVSVNAHYGIRWYELRKTIGDWFVHQQSTYSPDTNSRWMGSIAMDSSGNIGLGFSISGSMMYPSIRYTGRMKHDPPGQMTIAEKSIMDGSGSQTGSWSGRSRWGDYSSMSVDPLQPQTFWYTQEYYTTTSQMGWQTRIGAFSFAGILSIRATSSFPAVCSGGTVQLDVEVYDDPGNSSYSWTSVPPGYTSNLKNPVVSPLINTKYIVQVTNQSQSKSDTVKIAVIPPCNVTAGKDTIYCNTVTQIPVKGRAVNYVSVKWETSGDGTFTDPYSCNTFYVPGALDKSNNTVELEFTAYPQPPCMPVMDSQHIGFVICD